MSCGTKIAYPLENLLVNVAGVLHAEIDFASTIDCALSCNELEWGFGEGDLFLKHLQ